MKKIFLSVLLVLAALTSAMADGSGLPITLIKRPAPITRPQPSPQPLSLTDEDDNVISLEAMKTDDVISLTASYATFAQVTIVSESGDVLYDQLEVLGCVPTVIPTSDWTSGSYLLYITVGDDLYEGLFLL